MKVICGLCNKTETGRFWKLRKEDWLVIFIKGHQNLVRCPLHKPIFWDERKKKDFKVVESELMDSIKAELKRKFTEMETLKKL